MSTWPAWAGVPICGVGELADVPFTVLAEGGAEGASADAETSAQLLSICDGQVVNIAGGREIEFTDEFATALHDVTLRASSFLAEILGTGLDLRLDVGLPDDWFAGKPPTWQLVDTTSGTVFAPSDASAAQQRWSALAIGLALQSLRGSARPVIFLCDEPELGLHQLIEGRLPVALVRLAAESGASIVAATHSPAMLDHPSVQAIFTTRLDGKTVVRPLPVSLVNTAEMMQSAFHLGMRPSTLLQMVRVFVLVEGAHDVEVLSGLLGEELERARARLLPVGGAKHMGSMAESEFLLDFTDAAIVVVMDGLAPEALRMTWQEAQQLAESGDLAAARGRAQALLDVPGWEAKWMFDLIERCLKNGQWDRLQPASLSQPDVICYLPSHAFVQDMSWRDLLTQWRRDCSPERATDLKGWLRRRHEARISLKRIRDALAGLTPHAELRNLGVLIQEAGSRRPS